MCYCTQNKLLARVTRRRREGQKLLNIMSKCLPRSWSFWHISNVQKASVSGDFVPQTPCRRFAPETHWGTSDPSAPIAVLSGNESSNDVCSALKSWTTRNQRHEFMAGWHWQKIVPDLPLLFKMREIWSVDYEDNYWNRCHQMSDFYAKMHQIRFRLGLCPRSHCGSLHRSPILLAGWLVL